MDANAAGPLRARTPNFKRGRDGNRPALIIVHTTVGSFESALSWFARASSGVSSHYVVGLDGRLAQLVNEGDTARHAGRVLRPTASPIVQSAQDPNLISVGIEFEDGGDPFAVHRPSTQYETGARLIAGIARRWAIPLDRDHVIGHREVFAAKECPGNLDIDRLLAEARSVGGAWKGS